MPGRVEDAMAEANVLGVTDIEIGKTGNLPTVDGLQLTNTWNRQEVVSLLKKGMAVAIRVHPKSSGPDVTIDHVVVVVQCSNDGDVLGIYDPDNGNKDSQPINFDAFEELFGRVNWKYISRPLE